MNMTKSDKIEAALEVFSNTDLIRELGIKAADLSAIRSNVDTVVAELEKAELRIGMYEVNGRHFEEPIKGPASFELQSEIDIHNEHTGDNKIKRDYLINVVGE
ncbi:hypothetical protein P7F88_21220 [Vibrio hannami]|uniref:hypothetical protein n=1 Tax=Vibrio hannami TaxID=2717094 RepID=UPI00240F3746|nr:hypothetical protein [Vibrio hannami]MDG3088444.1 hypothetical protein [Vibrio hannami]